MPAVAERKALRPRRSAKALFANSPLTALDRADPAQIIDAIRAGLPAESVDYVAQLLCLSRAAFLEAIKIPASTIERRLRNAEPLSSDESDRVSRVAKVFRRAVEVFADQAQATMWMTEPITTLGGKTPVSLLDTVEGYELVAAMLSRIEYGVYG